MMRSTTSPFRNVFAAAALALACGAANAADRTVSVELNKLESSRDACRAYVVLQNTGTIGYETLKLDLVVFDVDGIVATRLAFEGAPLPIGKTSLKVFDIDDLACPRIGRLLLNDVVGCSDRSGSQTDCLAGISTEARGAVPFIK